MEPRHGLPRTGGCYDGPRAFLQRAEEPWLLEREAENNLVLGLADSLSRSTRGYESPLYFATVEHAGEVQGCAFRTPPYKLGLTRMPVEAASLVASDVAEVFDSLPAVLGPLDVARRVGGRLGRAQGRAGRGRHATADPQPGAGPVLSMAAFPARTRNTVRVGYVYTPAEHRRRGYASALVARVSRHILDSGFRQCVLYTDLQPHLSGDWIPSHPGRDGRELHVSGGPGTPRAGSRHLDRPGSRK